jgi:rhamnose utilization protein RhaD (predicted bifunctional aldolase and dehydrogenase)
MVRFQKAAMTDPTAPTPSVEAILHAIIPFQFVDHTHSDAVVAITNTPDGEKTIQSVLGDRVLYVPYIMPGFALARLVFELTRDVSWQKYEGMVLQHHGIFSFADDARESYERMIALVSKAEDFLKSRGALEKRAEPAPRTPEDLRALAALRRNVARATGSAVVARLNSSADALAYAGMKDVAAVSGRGPLTPDHVIHTKRTPLLVEADSEGALAFRAQRFRRPQSTRPSAALGRVARPRRGCIWPHRQARGRRR